jgi:hypothetical protein
VSLRSRVAVAATALLSVASLARADAPFVWTVTTTSGPTDTVQVRSDSLIRATDEVILGQGSAAPLADRDVSATLNYAGVRGALQMTLNADRTSGSLRYAASHGPTDTFSATGLPSSFNTARVIDNQVYSDLTDPHHQEFENLQQVLNHQSYIMPLDGNPSAATGFLADQTFGKYGLVRVGEPQGYESAGPRYDAYGSAPYQPVFWFDTMGMSESTNGFDGYDLRYSFNAAGRFSPHVGWSASVPYQYRDINGAKSETLAVEFGLPVDIVRPDRRNPFGWTVTPFVEFGVNDSRDLGSTQGIFDGGVASRLSVHFGRQRRWTFAYASQFTGYAGLGPDRDDDGYGYNDGGDEPFRGHLAQQLFKNGLQLARRFDHGLSADLSVTYSTFVANAATDQWWTPRAEVAWQFSPNFCLRVAYQADLANRYQSQGGNLSFDYRY